MNELSSSLDNMGSGVAQRSQSRNFGCRTCKCGSAASVNSATWGWKKKRDKKRQNQPYAVGNKWIKDTQSRKTACCRLGLLNGEIYGISRGERGRGGVWQGAVHDVSLPPWPGSLCILPANACPAPAAGIKHLVWQCNDTLQQSVMRGSQQSPGSKSSFS